MLSFFLLLVMHQCIIHMKQRLLNPEREYNEKRQDDDRKTKQKMELIRSKLKTHARKVKNS